MEITIHDLAKLANVSTRTLRYYDQIKLLIAKRNKTNKNRYYTQEDVDLLQQICLYKQMNMPLKQIKILLNDPSFDCEEALQKHLNHLMKQQEQLSLVIKTVQKTIWYKKEKQNMSNQEKFIGLKEKMIAENEKQYGQEIRKLYGKKTVEESNQKMKNMSQEDYDKVSQIEKEFFETVLIAFNKKDIFSKEAKRAVQLHQQWITYFWKNYDRQAHINLAKMYTEDERFRAYYDQKAKGLSQFIYEIIQKHVN